MGLTPLPAMEKELSRRGGVAGAIVAAAIVIGVFQPVRANAQAAPPTACDSAASFAYDPQRVAPGVAYDAINAPFAIPQCVQAVRLYPASGRLNFEFGRALEKAGRLRLAIDAYKRAAMLGHGGGFNNLGELYRAGKGVPRDLSMAQQQFERGTALGYPEAQFNLANLLIRQAPTDSNVERARQLLTSASNAGYSDAVQYLQALPPPQNAVESNARVDRLAPSTTHATGPSFDCAKIGRDALSTIICTSPDLSAQNLLLGQTYYALRHQVGTYGHDALKAEAKASNVAMKQHCAVPATTPLPLPAQSYVACIQSETDRVRGVWMSRLTNEDLEEAQRPIDQLIAAQQELIRQGFLPNTTVADGIFGDATRKALSSWQEANGIPNIGTLNDKTAALLLNVPVSSPSIIATAKTAVQDNPNPFHNAEQASTSNSGGAQSTRQPTVFPPSAISTQQPTNTVISPSDRGAAEKDESVTTTDALTQNHDVTLLTQVPKPVAPILQTTPDDTHSNNPADQNSSDDQSALPRSEDPDQARQVPIYETFGFWGAIGSGTFLLIALAYAGKHFAGVRTVPDDLESVELWAADREEICNRVKSWLTSGPLSYQSKDVFDIVTIRHFLVPFGSCAVRWNADWSGNVGEVDRGSLNSAMNIYNMAKSNYDLIPESIRHRHTRPDQPRESDHILWRRGGNSVSGTINYNCLCCADVTGLTAIPADFRKWSTEITLNLKKAHHLGDGSSFGVTDISATTSNWARMNVKPLAIPSADPDSIKSTLSQEVEKQAAKAVRNDLPKYHSNVGHSYQFSVENWHYWLVPIFLISYKSPKGEHVCVVDGLTGRLFHGSKVLDVGGALRRRLAQVRNIFRKPPPKLLAPPLKALPAPVKNDAVDP